MLKKGAPAAAARTCDSVGANETLCTLAKANCTWVSAVEEARLEFDYELERWLPIFAIVVVAIGMMAS